MNKQINELQDLNVSALGKLENLHKRMLENINQLKNANILLKRELAEKERNEISRDR
jgi:hypothetical protein